MSIKKIAFFVEGLTERLFLEKLLTEIFGEKRVAVNIKTIKGGSSIPITISTISSKQITDEIQYYILIYDCGGDSTIKSYIKDQRDSLLKNGYLKIIGLRDVFPDFKRTEIPILNRLMYYGIPQSKLPIKFILSIMEIEAWFLTEENHFGKIHTSLTPEYIFTNLGFNPRTDDTTIFDEPSQKLNDIYHLAGLGYNKSESSINRTINSIDYGNIYFNSFNKNISLKELIDEVNSMI
ncbi:MAG: hypothetical protein WDA22_12560 [Bacteroidota bacterium]